MGLFSGFRTRRRERLVVKHPISDDLWNWAIGHHRIVSVLTHEQCMRLRWLSTAFLAERLFLAGNGVALADDMKLSIALQACLPILELGLDAYRDFSTILVVPDEYAVTRSRPLAGIYEEYEDDLAGEVMPLGPVVLSYRDVEASGWGDGYNVVIHEAAHKLDQADGVIDGVPVLPRSISYREWTGAFGEAFADLSDKVKVDGAGRVRGKARAARMDDYAVEDPGEFFAVACEYFFERPTLLADEYPVVFGLLARYFRFSLPH